MRTVDRGPSFREGVVEMLIVGSRGMLGTDLMDAAGRDRECAGVDIEEVDIGDRDACVRLIREYSPSIVINAAAYTNVDGCETNREDAFRVNAEGVENLAIGCRETGALLVHVSTDYIFDGTKGTPYIEEDDPNPRSVYGKSKLDGERRMQRHLRHYLIIRTAWLYGRNGRNFIRTILDMAESGKPLKVVDDQWGAPTYTVDLARAILALVDAGAGGVFHVSNTGFCNWWQVAKRVVEIKGYGDVEVAPITTAKLNRPAERPLYSVFNCERFSTTVGWEMREWDEALEDYIGTL
ncbi:dTDP-4-dehydrorhamnose reductase [Thermodesulfobacteriota bacterium]